MVHKRKPVSGEFYKHFKGNLYQIITVAIHSESNEELVIYQALYGDYRTYARPLSMFVSEVDSIKYPEITQQYRFEKITFPSETDRISKPIIAESVSALPEESAVLEESLPILQETEIKGINPIILKFLDAESPEERLRMINDLKTEELTQEIIDIMSISLDFVPDTRSLEQGLLSIKNYLKTFLKYNSRRLR